MASEMFHRRRDRSGSDTAEPSAHPDPGRDHGAAGPTTSIIIIPPFDAKLAQPTGTGGAEWKAAATGALQN
ncbi:hypothetical protein VZT92_011448 [Zoarces viviparus]|uniref:Uncharacterized protein n=1 Tax=Zoarces viviparus TaxID=48416 RepID=A0AAW1F8R8_ZOAVI